MKKKFLIMTVAVAALTMSTAFTALAGSWKTDGLGTYYENDNGTRPVYAGWFTDPADGSIYYMDPDGYMMSATTVEGYRLGDDGRRIEKTEEDLAREAEREARLAAKPSPAKKAAAANQAAKAAKTTTSATGTTRGTYIAEMTSFMDKIFIAAAKARQDTSVNADTTKTNAELTYAFVNPDGYPFLKASIWKVAKSTGVDYHENSTEVIYHYDAVGEPDSSLYASSFEELVVAAVGDTEGKAVVDALNAERSAGTTTLDRSGNTDTGNSYALTYRNNLATLKVVCSEVEAVDETAETTTEDTASETTAEETSTTVSSSVVVAGQGSTVSDDTSSETESTTDSTDENTAETTEEAAEETADANTEA